MDIKVIDNFADIETQLKIIKNLQNENLYGYDDSSVSTWIKKTKGVVDYPQFTRIIFEGISSYVDNIFFPLIYQLMHINKLSNYFIYKK